MTGARYTLYQMPESGNCYKVRLLLHQLGKTARLVTVDIINGESRSSDFLNKNPNGRVPLLELPDGTFLAESNAILWFLAEDTSLLPTSKTGRAQILQWMFFEQYSHEPYIATSRYWISILGQAEQFREQLAAKQSGGYAALDVMEKHLTNHNYFVEEAYSIADICLYAYSHVAEQGNFNLTSYPAIRSWINRIASQPLHINITA